jgi:hypothetical protein
VIINTDLNLRWVSLAVAELSPGALINVEQLETGMEISSETELPSEASILEKAQELSDAYLNKQYARDRAEAYPSIADQLDMIFHAGLGGDEFQAAIQAVKDAYPKPE